MLGARMRPYRESSRLEDPWKVALVFPPQGHFTQPYLSSAVARGVPARERRARGRADRREHRGLRPLPVARAAARARSSASAPASGLAALERRRELGFSEMERYQRLSEIELIGDEVAARIEEAKRVLRTQEEFYDYERYLWAGRTIEQALRLVLGRVRAHAPDGARLRDALPRRALRRDRRRARRRAREPVRRVLRASTRCRACSALDPDLIGHLGHLPEPGDPGADAGAPDQGLEARRAHHGRRRPAGLRGRQALASAPAVWAPDRQLRDARGRAAAAGSCARRSRAERELGAIDEPDLPRRRAARCAQTPHAASRSTSRRCRRPTSTACRSTSTSRPSSCCRWRPRAAATGASASSARSTP